MTDAEHPAPLVLADCYGTRWSVRDGRLCYASNGTWQPIEYSASPCGDRAAIWARLAQAADTHPEG